MKRTIILLGASLAFATGALANTFGDKDANGDGQITKAEYDATVTADWTKLDADGNGQVSTQEAGGKAATLASADTNGDGQISQSEFLTKKTDWWTRADADGNGSVSQQEFAAASPGDQAGSTRR